MLKANSIKFFTWGDSVDPAQLTYRGVLLIHATPNAASVTSSFVAGAKSVCGSNIIVIIPWSIPGFIAGGETGMVRLLNIFVQNSRC